MESCELKPIAHIYNGFTEKFGIPRQSGIVAESSKIVFEPEYRDKNALRGLEGYSHIWLIWGFSESFSGIWSPTVRPPRLGGNARMGVFATRSPNRPNPLGLSSVELCSISELPGSGKVLTVNGADLKNGTPIYDIKPYLPFTDSHPEASAGFSENVLDYNLKVVFPPDISLSENLKSEIEAILAHDPRPSYQNDPERVYGMSYSNTDIRFSVDNGCLRVISVKENNNEQ